MRKLICMILALAMALSLCACGAEDTEQPNGIVSNDEIESRADTQDEGISDQLPEEIVEIANHLGENGYNIEYEPLEVNGSMFEFTPVSGWIVKANGEEIIIEYYESEEQAAKHASNFSSSGSSYNYVDADGLGYGTQIDYIAPVHFWLGGECIIQYCSFNNDLALILTELYGEQFAGAPIDEPVPEVNTGENGEIGFSIEYAKASVGETDLRDAEPISSREELEEYFRALKDSYYWSPYREPYIAEFETVMSNYPAEWFENNSLIIVRAVSANSPAKFSVNRVSFEDGTYTVLLSCEAGEDDLIEEGYIFIGLGGVRLSRDSRITLINAYPRPSAENTGDKVKLTLEKLIELDESGEKLSWSDFNRFEYDEVGSEMYIRRYFLRDRGFLLLIGGRSLDEDPMHITLEFVYPDSEVICEVGDGNVREFAELHRIEQ